MANAWQVRFQPTILSLKPDGQGNFTSTTVQPASPTVPQGSFPVVITATPRLSERNSGSSPIAAGKSSPATMEFIARPAPAAGAQPGAFVVMGTLNGTVDFNTSGAKPLPRFTARSRRVGAGPTTEIDYTHATTNEIARSDWVLRIGKDADTFDTGVQTSFFVRLPWQFIENPGKMQLTVRLRVGGNIAADESINTPLDLPLRHLQVPDNAKGNTVFTFFGMRNIYTKANADSLPKIALGARHLRVILHVSFRDFCTRNTSASVADVTTGITQVMNDAGFTNVDVVVGQAADTECNTHWRQVGGHFMGARIRDPDGTKAEADRIENRLATAIGQNKTSSVKIPAGMEEVLPFFDFYVFAEPNDPPQGELGDSEVTIPALLNANAATKANVTPIVIPVGTSSSNPLRKMLGQIATSDHVNLLATTVCHEIGHTFGLRHAVAFIDAPPYVSGDPSFERGTMANAGLVTGSGTPPMPLGFFGPVHQQEIRRLFL